MTPYKLKKYCLMTNNSTFSNGLQAMGIAQQVLHCYTCGLLSISSLTTDLGSTKTSVTIFCDSEENQAQVEKFMLSFMRDGDTLSMNYFKKCDCYTITWAAKNSDWEKLRN